MNPLHTLLVWLASVVAFLWLAYGMVVGVVYWLVVREESDASSLNEKTATLAER